MTEDLNALALSVSRCREVGSAQLSTTHPCHKIVGLQNSDPGVFQVPEAWAGNLPEARIVFVSSNPSISEVGDAQSGSAAEVYPTSSWDDDRIVQFVTKRFDHCDGWAKDSR